MSATIEAAQPLVIDPITVEVIGSALAAMVPASCSTNGNGATDLQAPAAGVQYVILPIVQVVRLWQSGRMRSDHLLPAPFGRRLQGEPLPAAALWQTRRPALPARRRSFRDD
jgi:hypothetical protein